MVNNLSKGFTSNTIMQIDGHIVKSGACIQNEIEWYESYKDKADIPQGVCNAGGLLVMNYIDRAGDININDVLSITEKYSKYPPLNNLPYTDYIERIKKHLVGNIDITNGATLIKSLIHKHLKGTFCHGDLSVDNIIPSRSGLKIIDPLYSKTVFGSVILDYAKLAFSLKFYANDIDRFNLLNSFVHIPACFIASECVRVATYKKQYSFIAENLINEL